MGQARLAEVHLVVDEPRQQELALQVDLAVDMRAGRDRADAFDESIAQQDVGPEATAFIHEFGVAEGDGSHADTFTVSA
jgi:hypothetical protein